MKKRSGGKWFGWLLVFAGMAFAGYTVVLPLYEVWQMQSWISVEGRILSTDLQVSRGDDGDTYKVVGNYEYEFNGQTYQGSRIGLYSGSDNIGRFHQNKHQELKKLIQSKQPLTVYVNPGDSSKAIIYRDVRPALIAFKLVFAIIFASIGIVFIYFNARKNKRAQRLENSPDAPWLANTKWQGGPIFSGAKFQLYILLFGAVFWNAVCLPGSYLLYPEFVAGEIPKFIVLFPLIGLFLIYQSYRHLKRWLTIGKTPLFMDPFPGSIGGNVGGYIEINRKYVNSHAYEVRVSCLYSYETGTGKNRSRKERLDWQGLGIASANGFNNRTRVKFRFQIPEGLPESDVIRGKTYHLWRISMSCHDKRAPLERNFEVPVFATKKMSATNYPLTTESKETEAYTTQSLEEFIDIQRMGRSVSLYMPMGKRTGTARAFAIFGLGAIAVCLGIADVTQSSVPLWFISIGGVILLLAVYSLGKSIKSTIDSSGITSITCFLGISLGKRTLAKRDFREFSKKVTFSSSSGHKSTDWYVLEAISNDNKKIKIVERLRGEAEVDKLIDSLKVLSGY